MKVIILFLILCDLIINNFCYAKLTENQLKQFLNESYEKNLTDLCYKYNEAEYAYNTDINNKEKKDAAIQVALQSAKIEKDTWEKYFKDLDPNNFNDEQLKRQVKFLKVLGNAALDETKLKNLTETTSTLSNIYSTGKICPYKKENCNIKSDGLSLDPEIETIMATSTDYNELKYIWTAWRDASGAKMKNLYKIYVELSNDAAKANNFTDKGELWRSYYESPKFIEDIEKLWKQVEPLYTELLKYVTNKLKERYGEKLDTSDGLVPAHVFGNMWAQSWTNLGELVKPFKNATKVDIDKALKDEHYTPLKMFQTSDYFYKSMGLIPNDMSYDVNKGALIEKPSDRDVVCHASAWDFCNGKDYRIKMCTKVNAKDFVTIHHEMGHIQYFLQYKHQPYTFRNGANPGFHEAIGDTIALSVSTPKHLKKIGLLKDYQETYESDINALMDMALERVAFLPFGLLIDKWRWDVFSGKVTSDKWNQHWWHYRKFYQKIKPPVNRSDEVDFDPGAKFHVPGDSQYINYFIAHILEFQLYKSLCMAAGEYDPNNKANPLYKCDFYMSLKAGDKLKAGLSLGLSKHWTKVLNEMTGQDYIDASPILEYFEPLYQFLKKANQ